jgi:micrococcal nuclease
MNPKPVIIICICAVLFITVAYLDGQDTGIRATSVDYPTEVFVGETAYPVLRIIDGDTVKIKYNGKATSVRLIGVDTPDDNDKEAYTFNRNLLLGESVYLQFDRNKTDKYGRLLGYLYRAPDGLFVNLEIVRQGYGNALTRFPFKYTDLFQHYEARAKERGIGLWDHTSPPNTADTKTVYITRTGAKYHRASCRYLRKSMIPISLSNAKQNYSPCSVCRP